MRTKSPLLLRMLIFLFFAAASYFFLQAGEAISRWNMLILLKYHFGPLYPVFQGVFLGGAYLIGGILLVKRSSWAAVFGGFVILLNLLWAWLDRTLFSLNPLPFSHQIFAIICSIMITVLMEGGLRAVHPFLASKQNMDKSSSEFFSSGENHE